MYRESMTAPLLLAFLACVSAWIYSYQCLAFLDYGTNIDMAEVVIYRGQLRFLYVQDPDAIESKVPRRWSLTPPPPPPPTPVSTSPATSTSPSPDLIPYADLLVSHYYDWNEAFWGRTASRRIEGYGSSVADLWWNQPMHYDMKGPHDRHYFGGFRVVWGNALAEWPRFSADYYLVDIPFAYPTVLFASLLALGPLRRYRLRRHRLRHNLCLHCGYDLRASPARCPECGLPSPPASGPEAIRSTPHLH
jgi:hypothetical protein